MNISLVQENLIVLSSFKQDYYFKKVYYAGYVKNILLPLSAVRSNVGNSNGTKIPVKIIKK